MNKQKTQTEMTFSWTMQITLFSCGQSFPVHFPCFIIIKILLNILCCVFRPANGCYTTFCKQKARPVSRWLLRVDFINCFAPCADLSRPEPNILRSFLLAQMLGVGCKRSAQGANQFLKSTLGIFGLLFS